MRNTRSLPARGVCYGRNPTGVQLPPHHAFVLPRRCSAASVRPPPRSRPLPRSASGVARQEGVFFVHAKRQCDGGGAGGFLPHQSAETRRHGHPAGLHVARPGPYSPTVRHRRWRTARRSCRPLDGVRVCFEQQSCRGGVGGTYLATMLCPTGADELAFDRHAESSQVRSHTSATRPSPHNSGGCRCGPSG